MRSVRLRGATIGCAFTLLVLGAPTPRAGEAIELAPVPPAAAVQQAPATAPADDGESTPEAIDSDNWGVTASLVLLLAAGAFLLSLYGARRLRVRRQRRPRRPPG